ncbi:MAG: ABC transporter permease [Chitinophagales bacterium]
MFRNYFKTAFRNLIRNKIYAILNILGLAIGMAACLLIFLVVRFETSYDNFHPKRDSIYRVASEFHTEDGISHDGGVAFPVGPSIRLDFPQIKQVARIFDRGGGQITAGSESNAPAKKMNEDHFFYAEPEFFDMFRFEWLMGDPATALKDPGTAVLTKKTAEKYFNDWRSAIGKTFMYNNENLYKVTGILKDIPNNTDFPLNTVASYKSLDNTYVKRNLTDWVSTFSQSYCFVVLPSSYTVEKFNIDLKAFAQKHKPADYSKDAYVAQPLKEMHYDSELGNFRSHTFSHSLITALILIGVFLLIIACVNFINLATAQAVNRSKEVGVRKVLGGIRSQLAFQFLCETAIIASSAMILAITISYLVLPFLNQLLHENIPLNFITNPMIIACILGSIGLVTLLAGFYPALVISGFSPVIALKNRITARMAGGISLRRILVILQFSIAHVLIIGMLIVVSQMDYFRNASLGFDKTAMVNVPIPNDSISLTKFDFLKTQLLKDQQISKVSFSFTSPSSDGNWSSDFKFDHAAKNTNFSANLKWADADYFKTYNLQFVAGRPFYPNDTVHEFVVNETLIHKLGIRDPQAAIGKIIDFWDGVKVATIVGVIRDFNVYSLKQPMAPVVLSTWKSVYQTINIKVKPGSEAATLQFIEKAWNEAFPKYVYEYHFLDDTIKNFYSQENQLSKLYKIFAGIAIFISCLGLYGLVSFMAVQRTKEVGIRKLLGASVSHIVYLMSREFTILILIAFVIAGPLAYYIMHNWLQNYFYRIPLSASIFLMAIAGSVLIAWVTVGYRSIRAAVANPINSLRTE